MFVLQKVHSGCFVSLDVVRDFFIPIAPLSRTSPVIHVYFFTLSFSCCRQILSNVSVNAPARFVAAFLFELGYVCWNLSYMNEIYFLSISNENDSVMLIYSILFDWVKIFYLYSCQWLEIFRSRIVKNLITCKYTCLQYHQHSTLSSVIIVYESSKHQKYGCVHETESLLLNILRGSWWVRRGSLWWSWEGTIFLGIGVTNLFDLCRLEHP